MGGSPMAKYFISSDDGDDSTGDGTANNPWATVGKAIDGGTTPGPAIAPWPEAEPVELVLEPGIYREAVQCRVTPTESSPLKITGDFDGSLFAAGGKANPKTGRVHWRSLSDEATRIGAAALNLTGRSDVKLSRIHFAGTSNSGDSSLHLASVARIDVEDCVFVAGVRNSSYAVRMVLEGGLAAHVAFRRCRFVGAGSASSLGLRVEAEAHEDDYDAAILVEACLFQGSADGIRIYLTGGSGTGMPTGIMVQSCSFLSSGTGVHAFGGLATVPSIPSVTIRDTLIAWHGASIRAGAVGQVDEDGNILASDTPRVNTSVGANSVVLLNPAVNLIGAPEPDGFRPFGEPMADSMILGFGAFGTTPALDLLGRPYADPPACGALERVEPEEPEPDPEPGGITYIFQTEG